MKRIHFIAIAVVLVTALIMAAPLSAALTPKISTFKSNLYSMNKTGGLTFKPLPGASVQPVATTTVVPAATPSFRERYGGVLKPNGTGTAVMPSTTARVNITTLPTMAPTNLNNIWDGKVPGSDNWAVNLVGGSQPGTVPGDSDWGKNFFGGMTTGGSSSIL